MPLPTNSPGTYVEELPGRAGPITGAPTSVAAFIGAAADGPFDTSTPIASFADYERLFGGLSPLSPMSYAISQFFLNGGTDAIVVRVGQAGASVDAAAAERGMAALREARFNLLCVPPFAFDADLDAATRAAAIAISEEKRAVFIADPPSVWRSAADAAAADLAALGLAASPNAALYFPGFVAADPLQEGRAAPFAPCGAVAGIIARSDRDRGCWKAPAGLEATLRSVSGLCLRLSDAESGLLNPLGINCLRDLPNVGPVVWGARTLAGADRLASDWKYLPVRRLASYIEDSLVAGIQWAVFEPNGEALWAQFRLTIGAFLQDLFRQGAFAGATPAEAYFVRCGPDTTTPDDILNGIVNVVVGFAPLKPGEFVVATLQQQLQRS